MVPEGVATGPATVTVTNGTGKSASAAMTVGLIAPGLFSADGSGSGGAAASALLTGGDGSLSTAPTSACTPFGCTLPGIAFKLGGRGYLVLYGTGFRGRSTMAGVTLRIGDVPVSILYAGVQGSFSGLDQLVALLPGSVAGAGIEGQQHMGTAGQSPCEDMALSRTFHQCASRALSQLRPDRIRKSPIANNAPPVRKRVVGSGIDASAPMRICEISCCG